MRPPNETAPWTKIPSLEANSSLASQEIPPHYLECENSSPCSQQPTACPCPEPHDYGPVSSYMLRSLLILSYQVHRNLSQS
jgi:hypothetical protein